MSFSSDLKEEISKTENLANKEAVKYELLGYLITSNISEEKNWIDNDLIIEGIHTKISKIKKKFTCSNSNCKHSTCGKYKVDIHTTKRI